MRVTITKHGYERIKWQRLELKYELLSSTLSEELLVLIVSLMLSYKGSRDDTNFYCLSYFSFFFDPPFMVDLLHYIAIFS